MKVRFQDGAEVAIRRAYKMHDFNPESVRLTIEAADEQAAEDIASRDCSSIALSRDGRADVVFEGYAVEGVSASYDADRDSFSVTLAKGE